MPDLTMVNAEQIAALGVAIAAIATALLVRVKA